MRIYLKLILICFPFLLQGQVDYPYIKARISDSTSNTFYPVLTQRFNDSDSTLTGEDFYLLYYGAIFLPDYDTTKILEAERAIRLANYTGEFLEAYELSDSLLKIYPVSIQAYFEKAYACFSLKRFGEEAYNNKRYKVLIRTVMGRGDGKSFETACHINLHNDAYEIVKYLQLESKEELEVEYQGKTYEVVHLRPNKLKLNHLYFIIGS
ncbi:MAG: DUF4919 domain-containing protein [Cytophagaceae bacterium]|nr:DUF4919 domain-containing protein [Cytophagaceae bacterium]